MATGSNLLARIFIVLGLFTVGVTYAQDASSLLEQGLQELRSNNTEQAIKTLRKALAAEPTNKQVMSALGKAEWTAVMSQLMSDEDGRKIAAELFRLAQPVLPEKAFDQGKIDDLVKQAVTSKDYHERFEASTTLARVYGEFAVPALVEYLSVSNTDHKTNAHITLMSRIRKDAVLPLNEAMSSDNAEVRRMVAYELGEIGDMRSLAALSARAEDSDENVRRAVAEALGKLRGRHSWAAGMGTSALYTRLAKLYYEGNYRVLGFSDRPMVLWSNDGGLKHKAAPRHLYVLKLAEEAAYDALAADPANGGARALLARVIASEKISSDAVGGDDDLSQGYADGLKSARGTVAALGWETLKQALGDAIDQQDRAAAAFILDTMPDVYGGDDFTTDHPVVRAAVDPSNAVRLAAAEAILRFNAGRRISAYPDPDGFIGLVARSIGEVVPRNILVIDGDDARRNKMLAEISNAGYVAYDARSGGDGVVRAQRLPGLDLIIMSANLEDMEALAVLRMLGDYDRTKNVNVVVVGTTEQAADDEWRQLYGDKAKATTGLPAGAGLPTEEFLKTVKGALGDGGSDMAARYSRSATILAALAHTDTGNALFNWRNLTETVASLLAAEVPNDPPVRPNAIAALAALADASAMDALVKYFGSESDAGRQAAAGNAMAAICRANPVDLDDGAFQTLMKGTRSGDANVRNAAYAALGAANLTAQQRAGVAQSSRPSTGGGGE